LISIGKDMKTFLEERDSEIRDVVCEGAVVIMSRALEIHERTLGSSSTSLLLFLSRK
jgi:hypothetical protein